MTRARLTSTKVARSGTAKPSPDLQTQRNAASRTSDASAREALRSAGKPLDFTTRAVVESRFAHSFGDVRVHVDERAAAAARAIDSMAYTVGRDIAFDTGRYAPHTADGLHLLGHELSHVVQQRGKPPRLQRRPHGELEDDPLEQDAERDAFRVGRDRHGVTMSYREAMESIAPSPKRPAAADAPDTRERVLKAERTAFNDLTGFVAGLAPQFRTLLAVVPPPEPWFTSSNPNVQSALRVLNLLVSDLQQERFVVRFDQASGTNVAASYDFLNDVMHLKPFTGPEERTEIAISMLHEYAHILQDRDAERTFSRQLAPHVHSREEDLQREIGARREEVYFGEMLRLLKAPRPQAAIFGASLTEMVFRGGFETERTGKTKRERKAAMLGTRTQIETNYAAQLSTNASIKTYAIELTANNHAQLYWDVPKEARSVDLGVLPASVASKSHLNFQLEGLVRKLPQFALLFNRPREAPYKILTFAVLFDGEQITEFGVQGP